MTKGTRAAEINAELRKQLREAQAARRQLESLLETTRFHRDEAVAWRINEQQRGLPAVLAERERAEAATRRTVDEVATERQRWVALATEVRPTIEALIRAAPKEQRLLDAVVMPRMTELFGDGLLLCLSETANRDRRRNAMNAKNVKRSIARGDALRTPQENVQRLLQSKVGSKPFTFKGQMVPPKP